MSENNDERLQPTNYADLKSKQQENHNFHKVAAILADYGLNSLRLTDDWGGADFVAIHIDGRTFKVQLKGRLTFAKKYDGKSLYEAFPTSDGGCYLFPYDLVFGECFNHDNAFTKTISWIIRRHYHRKDLHRKYKAILAPYK